MIKSRTQLKMESFVAFADSLRGLSTCKAQSCATIVFTPSFSEVLAIGYNGPSRGKENDSCTHPTKTQELARCGCVHAEANAVAKLRSQGIMFTTNMPCPHCAGLIANCGMILGVIWREPYWTMTGLDDLAMAGVPTYKYPMDTAEEMGGFIRWCDSRGRQR